jgi:hypothetical protein
MTMLPSIANLLTADSTNSPLYHYESVSSPDSSYGSSSSSAMQRFLHEGFVWESPSRSTSSPSPSSPCYSDYSSSPSSPASAEASSKTSLSFILNDADEDDLAACSFGMLLPQRPSTDRFQPRTTATTITTTNNKRKRASSTTDGTQGKERRTTATKERSGGRQQSADDRKALTDEQRATLEAMFELDPLPGAGVKVQLADQLGVSLKSVQLWFQNHRSKLRKREKKRIAREEAARRAAQSKPRFVFHNMKAQAQANGFLRQFVVDVHHD